MTFLPGQTLSAAELQNLAAVATYTPDLVDQGGTSDLGSGAVQSGWYHLNGRCVDVWFNIQFGTSGVNAGSGIYTVTYPPGYLPMSGVPDFAIGTCRLIHDSDEHFGYVSQTGTALYLTTAESGFVSATVPWTWDASDKLQGHVTYLLDA